MSRQILIAVLFFCISGCAHKTTLNGLEVLSAKVLPGGWLKVKVNDEIYRLARFAMRDVPKDSVTKVSSAKAQPVIGICYLLTFQMKSGKQWQAELYKDVKGNVTLLEIMPLKKNKSKRVRL